MRTPARAMGPACASNLLSLRQTEQNATAKSLRGPVDAERGSTQGPYHTGATEVRSAKHCIHDSVDVGGRFRNDVHRTPGC